MAAHEKQSDSSLRAEVHTLQDEVLGRERLLRTCRSELQEEQPSTAQFAESRVAVLTEELAKERKDRAYEKAGLEHELYDARAEIKDWHDWHYELQGEEEDEEVPSEPENLYEVDEDPFLTPPVSGPSLGTLLEPPLAKAAPFLPKCIRVARCPPLVQ